MVAPVQPAPAMALPSAAELYNVNTGRSNARQKYTNTLAQNQYNRNNANIDYGAQQRTMDWQQGQQRQAFDDPYIGRGMFNSGVRGQGLENFYTGWGQQQDAARQNYLKMMGQWNLEDTMAGTEQQNSLTNLDLYEDALRADKAAEIRGII